MPLAQICVHIVLLVGTLLLSVVWANAYLHNILVTDDLHIILADFTYSIINPDHLQWFTTCPPPVFACPFPWMRTLTPNDDKQTQASSNHYNGKFNTINNVELREVFGPVLEKCFKVEYPSGKEPLYTIKTASTIWSKRHPVHLIPFHL
ncbi:hypothetical protein C8J57DRAFT_1248038 [Mycena rebaudengoi]|nr:hypothetical protein C8J57DRAFT_1248038 [Mycena rebaudengoi]